MDTSETYIKMCEKAEEIQKQWKRQLGDFAYNYHSTSNFHSGLNWGLTYIVTTSTWDKDIWLPRQDQLQEMVEYPDLGSVLRDLREFWQKFPNHHIDSMEQLWLAFVMKERYSKVWLNDDWVDN